MKPARKKKLEKAWAMMAEVQQLIADVAAAHAKYMEERSESWHESDAGEESDMQAGNLEDAQANAEEVVAALDQILH